MSVVLAGILEMDMTVCEKHRKTPAKGYSPCPGCEVERLQERLGIAERAIADLGLTPTEAKAGVARSKANKIDAERYRALRRGQKWSVVDGIGDTLRWDDLDAAIDAAIAAAMPANAVAQPTGKAQL